MKKGLDERAEGNVLRRLDYTERVGNDKFAKRIWGSGNSINLKILTRKIQVNNSKFPLIFVNFMLC